MAKTGSNIHSGHRERMRMKLDEFGTRFLLTHELLEMMLYSIVKYKNTNHTARALLNKFGGLSGLLNADPCEISKLDGVGDGISSAISALSGFSSYILNFESQGENKTFDGYRELGRYVTEYFGQKEHSEVALFLFNNRSELIWQGTLYTVDCAYAEVKPDKFIRIALERSAAVAVIAHTHPFGVAYPSPEDIVTNRLIEAALNDIGVDLMEHYVVSGGKFCGMMHNLKSAFFQRSFSLSSPVFTEGSD